MKFFFSRKISLFTILMRFVVVEACRLTFYNSMSTMEQHPVPQNVTTFQFRLIGDMTIKQFGYLAGGIIIAYICYKLPLPFFFTWPMALFSGLLGFGLAFVPVEERPMDVWIAAFIKNVYSPTQYVWQKTKQIHPPNAKQPASPITPVPQTIPSPVSSAHAPAGHTLIRSNNPLSFLEPIVAVFRLPQKKQTTHAAPVPSGIKPHPMPSTPQTPSVAPPVSKPQHMVVSSRHAPNVLDWAADQLQTFMPPTQPAKPFYPARQSPSPAQPPAHVPPQASVPVPDKKIESLEATIADLQKKLGDTSLAHDRILELQQQLTDSLESRKKTEGELTAIRTKITQGVPHQTAPLRSAPTVTASPSTTASVRVISPQSAVNAGIPRLTTFPNVVTGIVKDYMGNYLTGVLVTVRDKDGVPLRALKTNKLGQFAASTPLPNGTYLIEVEDPRALHVFDKAQITLTGNLLPALEITSKSQKQLNRDKLAREIFGDTQI